MNDFAGNILQTKFYACGYILLSCSVHADAHLSAALGCYLDAIGAETSMLLNCILQGRAIIFGAQGPLWEGRI